MHVSVRFIQTFGTGANFQGAFHILHLRTYKHHQRVMSCEQIHVSARSAKASDEQNEEYMDGDTHGLSLAGSV